MNAPYRSGIIFCFLLVLCLCDNNESTTTSLVDSKQMSPKIGHESDKCVEDGTEGDTCYSCCRLPHLTCYKGSCQNCNDETKCGTTPYETASQISLSIAMALGIIILLVVLWKMCFYDKMSPFRRYSRRARARMLGNANVPRSEDVTRTSVSSIQIRILGRLQNRPPRYESSYNYSQRIEAAKQESIIDEAPPAYDAVEETVDKGPPPPYTIDLDASTRQGIDNNSFIADEHSSLRNTNTSNASLATNQDLNTTNTAGNNRSATINCETVHI